MTAKKTITAEEFDRKFDNGKSVIDHLDLTTLRRPGQEPSASMSISRPGS